MADMDAAVATQLRNIEQNTGRTVADWATLVAAAGPTKHGEIIAYLKSEHGLTHGNANLLAHKIREQSEGGPAPESALLDAQYAGTKASLRPVYEKVVALAGGLGPDVQVVVQKTGVALRRRKQFALVQAATAQRVDLGLNLAGAPPTDRLHAAKGMCTHKVALGAPDDVDAEVSAWLRAAYDRAG